VNPPRFKKSKVSKRSMYLERKREDQKFKKGDMVTLRSQPELVGTVLIGNKVGGGVVTVKFPGYKPSRHKATYLEAL